VLGIILLTRLRAKLIERADRKRTTNTKDTL
jgi:hypothetical protein